MSMRIGLSIKVRFHKLSEFALPSGLGGMIIDRCYVVLREVVCELSFKLGQGLLMYTFAEAFKLSENNYRSIDALTSKLAHYVTASINSRPPTTLSSG